MTNSYSPLVAPVDASQYGHGLEPQGEHVAPVQAATAPPPVQPVIQTWGEKVGQPWQDVAHFIVTSIQSRSLQPIKLLQAVRDLHTMALMPNKTAQGSAALKAGSLSPGSPSPNAWDCGPRGSRILWPHKMVRLTYDVNTPIRFGTGEPVKGSALPSTRYPVTAVEGFIGDRYDLARFKISGKGVQRTRGYLALLAASAKAHGCDGEPKGARSKVTWDLIISDPIKAFEEASKVKGSNIAVERKYVDSEPKTGAPYRTMHITIHRSDVEIPTKAQQSAEAGLTPENIIGF